MDFLKSSLFKKIILTLNFLKKLKWKYTIAFKVAYFKKSTYMMISESKKSLVCLSICSRVTQKLSKTLKKSIFQWKKCKSWVSFPFKISTQDLGSNRPTESIPLLYLFFWGFFSFSEKRLYWIFCIFTIYWKSHVLWWVFVLVCGVSECH